MPATAPSRPLTGGRLAAVIAGALAAMLAALFLLAGTGLLWAESKKDDDGFYSTRSERFVTTTHAIASDDLDIEGDGVGSHLYGDVRLKVRDRGGKPVFAGIARTKDVDAYLAGSAHATLTDVDFDPFEPRYRETRGSRPGAPGAQGIWVASAEGAGTQTLDWDVEDGTWSVVVMNADGAPGVDASISAGANVPLVGDLGTGFMIGGSVLLVFGGLLLGGGLRRGA